MPKQQSIECVVVKVESGKLTFYMRLKCEWGVNDGRIGIQSAFNYKCAPNNGLFN